MIARVVLLCPRLGSAVFYTLEIMPMDTAETMPMPGAMPAEEPPTDTQDMIPTDLTQGYQFAILVRPDGYEVLDPEPIHPEPAMPEEGAAPEAEGEMLADRTELVRAILGVLEAHPVGDEGSGTSGEQAKEQMSAGFGSAG